MRCAVVHKADVNLSCVHKSHFVFTLSVLLPYVSRSHLKMHWTIGLTDCYRTGLSGSQTKVRVRVSSPLAR